MHKKLWFLIFPLLFFAVAPGFCLVVEKGISVKITDLRNDHGHVLVCLFKDGEGYPSSPEKAFKTARLSISNYAASTSFTQLPAGQYAIVILHDENDDGKMNKNFFGFPREGYGFSNNVMGSFGPPSFAKASLSYHSETDVALNIRTRY